MSEKYALISVFDKTNVLKLANSLISQGYTILSTGGTYTILSQLNNSLFT